jgi:IS1 family transposase
VTAKAVHCDEIWSFSYAKNKNVKFVKAVPEGVGDVWTWTAIDADSKLIVSWHVGDRSQHTGISFMGRFESSAQDAFTTVFGGTPRPVPSNPRINDTA